MGNNLINDIKAPELSQSGYGAGIKKVFDQIDTNFKILGNQDFVKGDKGWSIGHNEIHIVCTKQDNKTYFTKEGIDVLNTIIRETKATDQQYVYQQDVEVDTVKAWLNTIDTLKSVSIKDAKGEDVEFSLIDGITTGDLFNEITVYDPINPNDEYTIGATNDYVFKDCRFVVEMDNYNETYSSLCDCSCVVRLQVYDEVDPDTGVKTPAKKFVVIQNAPTLYFDSNNQAFCWRIGGQDTGLIAQGPKGESGQNAIFYIVQLGEPISDAPANADVKNVTSYMNNNGGWVDLATNPTPSDFKDANCIAFEPTNIDGDETPTSYFGKITENGGSFVVSCTNDNRIQTNLNLNWLAASFASIGTNKALKGLFVPIEHPVPDSGETYNDKPVHAIWHASAKGHAQIFSELHISPMGTYAGINTAANELSTIGSTKEGRLDAYSKFIHSDASLVFDYKDVFFIGHHNNDSDDENGVRIGIGTNDIFRPGDSVGYHSLIRFSDNSKIDMPGGGSLIKVSKIEAANISASLTMTVTGKLDVSGDTTLGATTIEGVTTINNTVTIKDSLKVGDTVTAKVNGVDDVYLGCPVGTVVMWAGQTAPEGWFLCNGDRILIKNKVPVDQKIQDINFKQGELQSLVNILSGEFGAYAIINIHRTNEYIAEATIEGDTITISALTADINLARKFYLNNETTYTIQDEQGTVFTDSEYTKYTVRELPDLQQKFPLGAAPKSERLFNGHDSYGNQLYANTYLGDQGGDPEVQLSMKTMPEHNHTFNVVGRTSAFTSGGDSLANTSDDNTRISISNSEGWPSISNVGGNLAHSNMPPYLAINFIIKYK